MKKLVIVLLLMCSLTGAFACTSVIITGKATKDGRPLMWKNTDGTSFPQRMSYSDKGQYPWIGLSLGSTSTTAWFGTNSTGFCIMNTKSHNLVDDATKVNNGTVMKLALDKCSNLAEFIYLLDTITKPLNVSSNYGVIDAEGAAAYIEVYPNGYYVVDVNDTKIAPNGFLVYTNYSAYGKYEGGQGYIRYQNAMDIIGRGAHNKEFTPHWIFDNLSRGFYQSLLGLDLRRSVDDGEDLLGSGFFPDCDFIPRRTSAVASVIQGVRKGENPELTTLWTALGYPPCSIAVPAWVKGGSKGLPQVIQAIKGEKKHNSPVCKKALELKDKVFSVKRGNGESYFDFYRLYNAQQTGYIQLIAPIEEHVRVIAYDKLDKWRAKGEIDIKELYSLEESVDKYVLDNFVNSDSLK